MFVPAQSSNPQMNEGAEGSLKTEHRMSLLVPF
ncbi:hypothetical protein ANRL4_04507 [Anaerolineae bacterium]|nr:hypothetical protein ANRL4_04507 [Anaerolineae bacterium]